MFRSTAHQSEECIESQNPDLEALSKQLAEKELELATLENQLVVFERRYARTVGILLVELDELEKEIARELYRLYPDENHRQGFQNAESRARSSQDAVNERMDQPDTEFAPSEELKKLYRQVAKTIHPDRATNEHERLYRNSLMARANEAYRKGDLEALRQILYEWEHRDEDAFAKDRQPYQLEQAMLQMKRRIKEIEESIQQLKESELYQLMLKVTQEERQGHDLLSEMANDLQQQIRAAKVHLDSLKRQKTRRI